MNAIIISCGDELITGQTVDTNSAWLSRMLARRGIATVLHATTGDDRRALADLLSLCARQAPLVLLTGGLGPTEDDVTRYALADAMGVQLALDPKALADIETMFRRRGRAMVAANRVQALMPQGAEALPNEVGTAPGIASRIGETQVYAMPGVPSEMRWMYEHVVANRLPTGAGAIVHTILHTYGAGESDLGEKIADLMRRGQNPTVGTTVAAGMVSVRVVAHGADADSARRMNETVLAELRERLGELVVGQDEQTMARAVGELLTRHGHTCATAESCTGGMLGQMLTAVSGSSGYYLGGLVTYSNSLKAGLAGVSEETLRRYGAVSAPVAAELSAGVRSATGADWALSVTGIAGPTGATADKPVGLVYLGLCGPGERARAAGDVLLWGARAEAIAVGEQTALVAAYNFPGERDMVRLRACLAAMNHLRLALMRLR
jgi:nicotinamide-nucleotide amidase